MLTARLMLHALEQAPESACRPVPFLLSGFCFEKRRPPPPIAAVLPRTRSPCVAHTPSSPPMLTTIVQHTLLAPPSLASTNRVPVGARQLIGKCQSACRRVSSLTSQEKKERRKKKCPTSAAAVSQTLRVGPLRRCAGRTRDLFGRASARAICICGWRLCVSQPTTAWLRVAFHRYGHSTPSCRS